MHFWKYADFGTILTIVTAREFTMHILTKFAAVTVAFSLCHVSYGDDSDLAAKINQCAALTDNISRLSCYDALSGVQPAVASKPEPTQETVTDQAAASEPAQKAPTTPEQLPESIGGGAFSEAAGKQQKSYRGHVTACKKSADRRWFYIFENGQVWKQVDRRRRRHKDCDFYVSMTEDTFGYVMQIEGEDTSIRVDRRR